MFHLYLRPYKYPTIRSETTGPLGNVYFNKYKTSGKATDEQVTEPDWMGMMAMCDLVRQQEVRSESLKFNLRPAKF